MKTEELDQNEVRHNVRERYGEIAESAGRSDCAPACCGTARDTASENVSAEDMSQTLGYSKEEMQAVPEGADLGLGCGNPQAIAAIQSGETVLDLGSGAGFDVFLAAKAVGPSGRVIGVDMTTKMLTKARENKSKGGYENVDFRLGEIENLPVADAAVDVIISNCVINLSPDKERVFQEAFRVLKPGGRLAVSDMIALAAIPEELRKDWELYTGCAAGASMVDDLTAMLDRAGFIKIQIVQKSGSRELVSGWFPGRKVEDFVASANIEAEKPTTS